MRNFLFFLITWVLVLFINFSLSRYFPGFFGFQIFWAVPFVALYFQPLPVNFLAVAWFGLTADSFVLNFPGLITFSYLALGYIYYRFHRSLLFEGLTGFLALFSGSLLIFKLLQYLAVLFVSRQSLFGWVLQGKFWGDLLLAIVFAGLLYLFVRAFRQPLKILY